jgi:hypothetical protein
MSASSQQTDGQPAFLDRLGNWIRRIPLPVRRRWVTPTVFQMEALECGAASLAMILAYHGLWVPLEKLREAVGRAQHGARGAHHPGSDVRKNLCR